MWIVYDTCMNVTNVQKKQLEIEFHAASGVAKHALTNPHLQVMLRSHPNCMPVATYAYILDYSMQHLWFARCQLLATLCFLWAYMMGWFVRYPKSANPHDADRCVALIPKLLCGHGRRQIEGDMMQISHSNHERSWRMPNLNLWDNCDLQSNIYFGRMWAGERGERDARWTQSSGIRS